MKENQRSCSLIDDDTLTQSPIEITFSVNQLHANIARVKRGGDHLIRKEIDDPSNSLAISISDEEKKETDGGSRTTKCDNFYKWLADAKG